MNNIKKVLLGFVLVVTLVVVGPVSQLSAVTYEEVLAQIRVLQSQAQALQPAKPQLSQQLSPNISDADDFSYTWNTDLRRGMRNNNDVRALQQALTIEDLYKGKMDGNFGRNTRSAVIKFQKKYSLKKNGIVGKAMREELNEIYGPDDESLSDNNEAVPPTPPSPTTTTTPRPSITVTSPNGGERLIIGQSYDIRWNTNVNKVNIEISKGSISNFIKHIAIDVPGNSTYRWTVPSNLISGDDYRILVSTMTADRRSVEYYDMSDVSFSIVADGTKVIAPNGIIVGKDVIILKESKKGELFGTPNDSYLDINSNAVIEEFYKTHSDIYDFMAVFPAAQQTSHYGQFINRKIKGIGLDDRERSSSSITKNLKLLAKIDLYAPYSIGLRGVDKTFINAMNHEIGHYWGSFLKGIIPQNNGILDSHWTGNINLFGGSLGHTDILSNWQWVIRDGKEHCSSVNDISTVSTFSSLSLYLMGMLSEENVSPVEVYNFQPRSDTYQPKQGEQTNKFYNLNGPMCGDQHTFTGTRTLTIQDIVAINGKREPGYQNEKKDFKIVFVVVVPYDATIDQGFVEIVKNYAQPFFESWKLNTRNISTMSFVE